MTSQLPDLVALSRRLERVENALADAQARLPGVRGEVRAIREAIAEAATETAASAAAVPPA